jgi:putative transcriptional regulator
MYDIRPGDMLVAPPNMKDDRFERSVLLVTHHQGSSLAFCLNKPSEHRLSKIVEGMDIDLQEDHILYWGGPVSNTTIWMLHDSNWSCDATLPINEQWSMTSHQSMFHNLADGDKPENFFIIYGHAGWGPGQLEGELSGEHPWSKDQSWLIVKQPDIDWVFSTEPDDLWNESTKLCGSQAVQEWLS